MARRDRLLVVGASIIFILILAIAFGWLLPYGPEEIVAQPLEPPSGAHPFGTDRLGFDVLTRVVHGTRIDLTVALVATSIAFVTGSMIGVIVGMLQGSRGASGWIAEGIMRGMDVVQAFPLFVLALALVATLGPSSLNVVAAIAFVQAPVFARIVRTEVLTHREAPYVEAAICSGNRLGRVALRHLLPNAMPTASVLFSVNIGFAILLTAGLSFVGAGVRVPTAEWGVMVSQGARDMITGYWWTVTFPGLAIGASVFGFALLGDGLARLLDPTKRSSNQWIQ